VFISGGSIEMHFHFFMIMALLVMYSDWRLGWFVLVLTALHHAVLNYLQPNWVYFYGRNDFAIVAHGLPVGVMAFFTTRLCQTQRQSVATLEETRRVQEEDLLKRREAEETLRESEEKSRYVIESAADAIVSIDASGAVREFNRAAERLFGYTAAEVAGEPLTRLIPERFHEAHRAEDRLMRAVSHYILGRREEVRAILNQVRVGHILGSPAVQRGRLLVLFLALRGLVRLPRIPLVANLFYRRWHVRGMASKGLRHGAQAVSASR